MVIIFWKDPQEEMGFHKLKRRFQNLQGFQSTEFKGVWRILSNGNNISEGSRQSLREMYGIPEFTGIPD